MALQQAQQPHFDEYLSFCMLFCMSDLLVIIKVQGSILQFKSKTQKKDFLKRAKNASLFIKL